ncbi:MAG TPA: DUF4038 domain-containing protein [Bacteroidales bacterium]|nr:DUF4038 domain-containing protein [Bacteroidales bacterium]
MNVKTRSGSHLTGIMVMLPAMIVALAIRCSMPAREKVVQWQPWESAIEAKESPEGRPYAVEVSFQGPEGQQFTNQAFSDDGKIYRFRAAFPSPGTWTWSSASPGSNDRGLNKSKGKVEVLAYEGDNPLYRHGDLRVSEDKRYLVHADGKPFLWIGETGWRSLRSTSMEDWRHYIDTRSDQKFTVIQVSPKGVSKNPGKDLRETSFLSDRSPDPDYWSDLDSKIRYANEKGIIIFMVGISKVWNDEFKENPGNQDFASYFAGRMAPYMVIFSPSFDQVFIGGNDTMAMELKKYTTHLVTQHPGTNYEANTKYRNSPYTDFCGMQSGHHGGRLERAYNAARQWTLDMWNGNPLKPVINIEGMYDARGNNNGKNWREKDVRKIGWISWLSGSKGYTYGAGDVPPKVPEGSGGVWRWNDNPDTYDYWKKAILWPSAGQMTIMHDFFKPLEWWKLIPAHELVLNQEANDTSKMVVSVASDKSLLLAYLPDNPEINLDLSGFSGTFSGKWLNPANGITIQMDEKVTPEINKLFMRPRDWDDALLMLRKD